MTTKPVLVHTGNRADPRNDGGRRSVPWRIVIASAVTAIFIALTVASFTNRSTNGFVVWSDGVAYFLYARSAVIDHDFEITDEYDYLDKAIPGQSKALEPLRKWSSRRADGTLQAPWPRGAGLIMTPFYAAGYAAELAIAAYSGRPANSYGVIPQTGFILGSVAFGLLGFWCLFLLCCEVAQTRIAYLASLGVTLGGPVVFYVLFNPSMAHASSFGLIALLTLVWIRAWKLGPTAATMVALGLILGIAATVRYQNAVFGIMLAALVLKEINRSGLALASLRAAIGLVACCVPVALILGGQLMMSAGQQGSQVTVGQYPIDLASPYFIDVLISCRHGAFHWAPVLAVGVLGLFWKLTDTGATRDDKGLVVVLLATLVAHAYLIGGLSLTTVAYGNNPPPPGWLHHWDDAPSFGMRYLTECAPVFALGLAFLMQATRRYVGLAVWVVALTFLATWNALLIVAYGLETVSRSGCLSYFDMLKGFSAIFRALLHRI